RSRDEEPRRRADYPADLTSPLVLAKDTVDFFGGDPPARVRNGDHEVGRGSVHGHRDATGGRRVFDRVVDEVRYRALDLRAIDLDRRQVGDTREFELDLVVLRSRAPPCNGLVHERG